MRKHALAAEEATLEPLRGAPFQTSIKATPIVFWLAHTRFLSTAQLSQI